MITEEELLDMIKRIDAEADRAYEQYILKKTGGGEEYDHAMQYHEECSPSLEFTYPDANGKMVIRYYYWFDTRDPYLCCSNTGLVWVVQPTASAEDVEAELRNFLFFWLKESPPMRSYPKYGTEEFIEQLLSMGKTREDSQRLASEYMGLFEAEWQKQVESGVDAQEYLEANGKKLGDVVREQVMSDWWQKHPENTQRGIIGSE